MQSTKSKNDLLQREVNFLNRLKNWNGFPRIHYYGDYKNQKILVQDLLGPSLDKVFKFCNKKFSMPTILNWGIEILDRLEEIHNNNILHRDIKPSNFVFGKYTSTKKYCNKSKEMIYLVDFGLSCSYINDKKHYDYSTKNSFIGTLRYASINTHLGIKNSRRDDWESMMYVWILFAKGELPWQGIKTKKKEERNEIIKNKKQEIENDLGISDLPQEFMIILNKIKEWKFEQKPDYFQWQWTLKLLLNRISAIPSVSKYSILWEWEQKILEDKKRWNEGTKDENNDKWSNECVESFRQWYYGYPLELRAYIELLEYRISEP